MNRKSFFKKFIIGLAGIATVPMIAKQKESDVKITDVKNHFTCIGEDSSGYKSYVCDGYDVHFTINGKDLVSVLEKKKSNVSN